MMVLSGSKLGRTGCFDKTMHLNIRYKKCYMDWPKLTKLKSLFTCFHIIQFESNLKLEWERFRFPSRVVFLVRRERDSMSWQFFSPTFVEWHNACRLLIDDLQIYFLSILPLYCVCLILSLFFLNQSLLSRGMAKNIFWGNNLNGHQR